MLCIAIFLCHVVTDISLCFSPSPVSLLKVEQIFVSSFELQIRHLISRSILDERILVFEFVGPTSHKEDWLLFPLLSRAHTLVLVLGIKPQSVIFYSLPSKMVVLVFNLQIKCKFNVNSLFKIFQRKYEIFLKWEANQGDGGGKGRKGANKRN